MAENKKYYHNLDVENNKVMNLLLNPLTTAQRTAVGAGLGILDQGYVCYDTTLNIQFFWDGTQWISGSGSGTNQNLQQVTAIGDTVSNVAGNCVSQLQFDRYDIIDSTVSSSIGFYANYGGGNPYFYIQNGGSLTATYFGADGINIGTNSFYFPISGNGTFVMSVNGVSAYPDGSVTIPVGTGTVLGSGTLNYIPKWTPDGITLGNSSIQDLSTGIVATNSVTAVSNIAKSVNFTSTLIASANSDLLSALDINTTFTSGVFTGLTKRLFRATANTILRTELRDSGIQSWYLNDGSSEVGQIGYSTPSGHPGIVMLNQSFLGRSDIRHMTNGGFTIATHTLGTPPPVDQFYFNPSGNFGIGTSNDVYKLDVNGEINTNNGIRIGTNGAKTGFYAGANLFDIWAGNNKVATWGLASPGGTLYDHFMSWVYAAGNTGTSSAFRISSSLVSTGANNAGLNQLLINPTYTQAAFGTGTLRGVYYNPTISSLNTSQHTAWENTSGDIIHGNLSGATTRMVVADTAGKLATQAIPSSGLKSGTASGTDTYTVTISGVTSYTDGDAYIIKFTNGNTTGCTLNISGVGAKTLYRNNDGALIGGDIQAGGEMICVYDATSDVFRTIGTSPNSIIAYVTNDDSVTITKGQPVYAFSGTGDRMTVKLAYNTTDATSAQTVGLVLSDSIAANAKGFIIMQGLLDGLSILPTSTWADGNAVYLGATAGTITPTKPYAPNHLVYLGFVTTASNGSAGRMYVRVQNGYELDELHNVQAQSPSLKDTLWYDNGVSPAQWKTASIPTILGYTPQADTAWVDANTQAISGWASTTIKTIQYKLLGNKTAILQWEIVGTGTTGGTATMTLPFTSSAWGTQYAMYQANQSTTAIGICQVTASSSTLTFYPSASIGSLFSAGQPRNLRGQMIINLA